MAAATSTADRISTSSSASIRSAIGTTRPSSSNSTSHPGSPASASASAFSSADTSPSFTRARRPAPVLARWQHETLPSSDFADQQRLTSPLLGGSRPKARMTTAASNGSSLPVAEGHQEANTSVATTPRLNTSPSDLVESIRKLSIQGGLADSSDLNGGQDAANEPVPVKLSSIATGGFHIAQGFDDANEGIQVIRNTLFRLEEKRHAQPSSSTDPPFPSSMAEEIETGVIEMDDRLETISATMQQLDLAVQEQIDNQAASGLGPQDNSDEEADSDDDADFSLPGLTLHSRNANTSNADSTDLRQQLVQLSESWRSIQVEVDQFKKEITDDKYISHFSAASLQAKGLMDSLEKAIGVCHDFVKEWHATEVNSPLSGDENDGEEAGERIHEKLQRLKVVKKAFLTKRSYYTPACEQTFAAFEHSLRERATSHGALLREFSELKGRWKGLREKGSKVGRELRRIETKLRESPSNDSFDRHISSDSSTPIKYGLRSPSPGTPRGDLPTLPGKSNLRPLPGRPGVDQQLSSLPASPGSLHASPAAPAKPLKSARRLVSEGRSPLSANIGLPSSASASSLQDKANAGSATSSKHNRSFSTGLSAEASLSLRPKDRGPSMLGRAVDSVPGPRGSPLSRPPSTLGISDASPSRRPPGSLPVHPPSSFRLRPSTKDLGSQHESWSPDQPPRFVRAGSEPRTAVEARSPMRPASVLGTSGVSSSFNARGQVSYSTSSKRQSVYGHTDADESMESLSSPVRPDSAAGSYAPAHYRPPSSATTHVNPDLKAARRQSRIPTFTFPAGDPGGGRPGSALSHASSTAFGGSYQGAGRSTMQTPEPMIAARVQRLSVYTKPSSGAPATSARSGGRTGGGSSSMSRPPTARSNPRSAAAGILSGSAPSSRSGSAGPGVSIGRGTPLSASALAKVPHAAPSLGGMGGSTSIRTPSVTGSSVANYRSSRYGGASFGGVPSARKPPSVGAPSSVRDGAVTPTFSESGFSTFSAAVTRNSGALYRPNPNDALDVEVAQIVNALGVPLTRIDPPLPRGAKTETGPGKDIRCRYAFGGGNAMTCKLLELHKPVLASGVGPSGGGQGRQRKVLVKVPGKGFVDLEYWLLSTLD